ncbi:MAG: hypothetical protein J3Q66DRAFT_365670 [Benniella sp.]|nr:MAG: hypothetical protein J3Q66DRAFT_365670 [Benniella sp.]
MPMPMRLPVEAALKIIRKTEQDRGESSTFAQQPIFLELDATDTIHSSSYQSISYDSRSRRNACAQRYSVRRISPPLPQPGVGVDPNVPSASDLGGTPIRTLDTNHATITASGTSPSPTSQPSIITTIINGTPTTLTTMTAASPAYQQPILGPNSIPKAPQSLLVVQSTTYGKVLPAVAPTDDWINSHFWDQFVPPSQGGQKSSASRTWPALALLFLVCGWHVG